MSLFKVLSKIQPLSFWYLLKLTIPHLLYLWPTYQATKKCMFLSTKHFGRKHYQNGQANAFRHALWNILIAKYCTKSISRIDHTLLWTKKITDWHEETFFNSDLPMKMDYHNNKVGRTIFKDNFNFSEEQFLKKILVLTEKAIKINKNTTLESLQNQLVYITDDH